MSTFKERHPFDQRKKEAQRVRAKYPDRIPIIAEIAPKSDIPPLDKVKYLVPADLTCGQFLYVIRKRIKLTPEKALFLFINNTIPPTGSVMSQIYEENKEDDLFLYCTVSGETSFGDGFLQME